MPRSRPPRKAMRPIPRHQADAQRLLNATTTRAKAPTVEVHKPALEPRKITNNVMSWRKKTGIFAGATAATGGTAYLYHHARRNRVKKAAPVVNIAERLAGQTGRATSVSRKGLSAAEPQGELYRRLTARRAQVKKFYDPFLEQEVGIEKSASTQGYSITGVRTIPALVATGRHVSQENNVGHWRGKHLGNVPRRQKLVHISR